MEKIIGAQPWEKQNVILGAASLLLGLVLLQPSPLIGALGCLAGVYLLFPGARGSLKLHANGFTYANGMFGEKTTTWQEVGSFTVITYYAAGFIPVRKQVGWTIVNSKLSIAGKVIGGLAGFNGCLPHNYGMKPQDLTALLETWRRQAVADRAA
jgi:hypothetical protein